MARQVGVLVEELDPETPFTAARARNTGLAALRAADPEGRIAFIQFIDGDCEIEPGWIAAARARLQEDPTAAVVCGRRRERHPDATMYNRLCDMEWNTRIGRAAACGGDSLMRVAAVEAAGGFNPTLIAGEEPDLCFRLRRLGWTIWRLDAPMTMHDAAMARFGQWWRRAVRGGWAYAEGAARHGSSPERYNVKAVRSIVVWGVVGPTALAASLLAASFTAAGAVAAVVVAAAHCLMAARIALYRQTTFRDPWSHAWLYGVFTMIGKIPQAVGLIRYLRRSDRPARLIEYK
jgi:hypothetical protein